MAPKAPKLQVVKESRSNRAKARPSSAAKSALEYASPRNVEFWPPDVPVLIGQLDGGEGKQTDSGFPLEADRTLLRVVGTGGVP